MLSFSHTRSPLTLPPLSLTAHMHVSKGRGDCRTAREGPTSSSTPREAACVNMGVNAILV